jgi:hypothetical protein
MRGVFFSAPDRERISAYLRDLPVVLAKLALTARSAFTVSVQVALVPLQAPPQPAKLVRDPVAAVSVTVGPVLLA